MEIDQLVNAIKVIELTGATRSAAVRALIRAGRWSEEGLSQETVMEAIEEREATAQTVVVPGLALPHATVDWDGDYRVVLGRSRAGIAYSAGADLVHLVVLVVVGNGQGATHLEVLSKLAELLKSREFRDRLISASNTREIRRLMLERATRHIPGGRPARREVSRLTKVLVEDATRLVESISAQALLLAVDGCDALPWDLLGQWTGRLLIVTRESCDELVQDRPDTHLFDIPHAALSRMDRVNLALLLVAAQGLVDKDREIVCVTGPRDRPLDSITVARPATQFQAVFADRGARRSIELPPAVVLRVLSLAIELATEGREGQSVGALFVIGDTGHVRRQVQQLVLNPFHGFASRLRNVLDPSLSETIKEFALLDGAFVIRPDGMVVSAGTYLVPQCQTTDLPGGLGARHQAAAAITTATQAIAITVSQSTGTVTMFQNGAIVLTLERATLTRW